MFQTREKFFCDKKTPRRLSASRGFFKCRERADASRFLRRPDVYTRVKNTVQENFG